MVVERQARRRRHRVAARARRHAPQLGGRPVRVGEHGGAAGLGEQPAARRYAVEPRCGVALEGERRGPPRERAAGGGGGHGHALVKRGGQAVGPVVHGAGEGRVGQHPRLRRAAVGLVEPHEVALGLGGVVVVERQARRRRHRVAARARRHAPQLGGRPVRVGEHGGAAGLGEQPAARRYAVEPRCGVALEGERRGPPRERAAGGGGGHGHALVKRGGQAVGPVVDNFFQSCLLVFSFQVVLGAPFAVRFLGDV